MLTSHALEPQGCEAWVCYRYAEMRKTGDSRSPLTLQPHAGQWWMDAPTSRSTTCSVTWAPLAGKASLKAIIQGFFLISKYQLWNPKSKWENSWKPIENDFRICLCSDPFPKCTAVQALGLCPCQGAQRGPSTLPLTRETGRLALEPEA